MVENSDKLHDLIIIGGGPAGLTTGLYAARGRLDVVLLERALPGGQVALTERVDNYPGFPEGIEGPELAMKMEEQARRFGLETTFAEAESISFDGPVKIVRTTEGEFRAKALVICSGATPKKLGVPGEAEFRGRGVSYCATCDGAFFRGEDVVVIGGGDAAVEESLYLAKLARKVTIIHRRKELRAQKVIQEKAFKEPRIGFLWDSVVDEIRGDSKATGVLARNVETGQVTEAAAAGVFIYVGMSPLTDFVPSRIDRSPEGYIITAEDLQTSVPGVFAAGDARRKPLRQVATAVGEGALAAHSVEKYLTHWVDERVTSRA
jgi:thioredoxin reductase (NADPH)